MENTHKNYGLKFKITSASFTARTSEAEIQKPPLKIDFLLKLLKAKAKNLASCCANAHQANPHRIAF